MSSVSAHIGFARIFSASKRVRLSLNAHFESTSADCGELR